MGSSSSAVPPTDVEGSLIEENVVPLEIGVLAYVRAFMVEGEPLPTNERARPLREGHGGGVDECIGKEETAPSQGHEELGAMGR